MKVFKVMHPGFQQTPMIAVSRDEETARICYGTDATITELSDQEFEDLVLDMRLEDRYINWEIPLFAAVRT